MTSGSDGETVAYADLDFQSPSETFPRPTAPDAGGREVLYTDISIFQPQNRPKSSSQASSDGSERVHEPQDNFGVSLYLNR